MPVRFFYLKKKISLTLLLKVTIYSSYRSDSLCQTHGDSYWLMKPTNKPDDKQFQINLRIFQAVLLPN